MSPLVWTMTPVVVTLIAIAWVSWRSRPRGPGDPFETVEQHRRFRAALARELPRPDDPK